MSSTGITRKLVCKKITNTKDIKSLLLELCDCDADFNGDNGEDYLWEEARKNFYFSNAEYVANMAITEAKRDEDGGINIEDCVKEFVHKWTFHDDYYSDTEVYVQNVGNVYAVMFTSLTHV